MIPITIEQFKEFLDKFNNEDILMWVDNQLIIKNWDKESFSYGDEIKLKDALDLIYS